MATRRLRAVLFDFDHTLTDFGHHVRWSDARSAVRAVYEAAGIPASFLDTHAGSLSLYISVAEQHPIEGGPLVEAQRRAAAILDEFEREAVATTEALPGALALVEALSRLGLRSAIVTSNAAPVARAILDRLGLAAPFEVVLGRSEVQRLKPAPEGLLAACAALEVTPGEAAYVGDSESDMRAAVAGGVLAWGVATGLGTPSALRDAGAEAVFATLTEVLARLTELHAMTARGA
ncbi:MAG: HAD family hydrolase [Dehalococcoidia bacterium]|nr:HAD family hydrolase [Dehalococcoidia bacterium]